VSYRVLWTPHAEERLEALLQDATARAEIAAAARDVDQQLLANPLDVGESRFEDVRVGFSLPLGVQFEVLLDVQTVVVYDVWRVDIRAN
jgi:hypothetical protein